MTTDATGQVDPRWVVSAGGGAGSCRGSVQPGSHERQKIDCALVGVAVENGKNRTLRLSRGRHPEVQRGNGHAVDEALLQ